MTPAEADKLAGFEALAKEAECDPSEAAFKKRLEKIATGGKSDGKKRPAPK